MAESKIVYPCRRSAAEWIASYFKRLLKMFMAFLVPLFEFLYHFL